mmetsp:Transcript_1364/g.3170  ORF Transcript_1364/g.3170 Transcript_1364/m.3170 type:complete len:206 (+) Transcript_1364:117-734(+)
MGFDIDVCRPWARPDWPGWRAQLAGPPGKLFLICLAQIVVLVTGMFVGIGAGECDISIKGGADVEVKCEDCREDVYLTWEHYLLLIVGVGVIFTGIFAALGRSKRLCRIYGLIMMVYAFVIGLTSVLVGLMAVVLDGALSEITDDRYCARIVGGMVHTARVNSILYAINCVLDIAGAIYAIKSKELFAYQEIAAHHQNFQRTFKL